MEHNRAAQNGDAIVRDLVRRFDRGRYWAARFAPEPVQSHLLALYAFNAELSRIPAQVSEAMFGEVRLQWWRDALDLSSDGERSAHPLADALAQTRRACDLPAEDLLVMVDARVFDINREPMASEAALENYLRQTASVLFKLAARIAGAKDGEAEPACDAAAMAYGLTGLLRAFAAHASAGRIFLPLAHFSAHNVDPASILRGETSPRLRRALAVLIAKARQHLSTFREAAANLPPDLLPVFLPLTGVEPALAKMSRSRFDPLRETVRLNPAACYVAQWRAFIRGRV